MAQKWLHFWSHFSKFFEKFSKNFRNFSIRKMVQNWVIFRMDSENFLLEIFQTLKFSENFENFRNYVGYYISFSKIAKMAIFEIRKSLTRFSKWQNFGQNFWNFEALEKGHFKDFGPNLSQHHRFWLKFSILPSPWAGPKMVILGKCPY